MTSKHLTRLGALAVTSDLDRIAALFQEQHSVLGIPEEYALRFAYYCDAMSDHVEKHAIKLAEAEEKTDGEAKAEEEGKEASSKTAAKKAEAPVEDKVEDKKSSKKKSEAEVEVKVEDKKSSKKKGEAEVEPKAEDKKARGKKAQEDETGLSVDHGESGYDANAIGDLKSGPDEIITPPVEAWMAGHFTQVNFQQLRDKQEGGDIGFFVSASKARLRRLAAMSVLSDLSDALTMLHAKLSASDMTEIKALAADVKKQADAVSKLRDLSLVQQATGMVEPEIVVATDKVVQAVTEQLPYLKEVVAGVDGSSPVALLEFQKMVGGGSLKELVALGASIVADAVKGLGKKEEAAKEASKKAEEVDEDEALLAEMVKEEEKKEASKKAEEVVEEVVEEKKEASKKAEEDDDDSEEVEVEEVEKTAFQQKYGYDLFAR